VCRCGRWLTRIGPIEGRVTDTLRDGRGRPVSGLLFNILFVAIAQHAKQFQAVQAKDGRVTLRVVPENGAFPEDARKLTQEFSAKYLPGVPFVIEEVGEIPTGPAGKRRLVIVET